MADSEEWFVGEDGILSVSHPSESVTYHSSLNSILVVTKEPSVQVLDVTSGLVLKKSDVSSSSGVKHGSLKCSYLQGKDKVLLTDGLSVSVRKDLNGILLLDSALQSSVSKTEDVVRIELPLPEANHLFKSLMTAELAGVDYVEEVLWELEKGIEATQQAAKASHKVNKWSTVSLKLPHCALKTVCSNLVSELKRLHQHVPGLPVASAVNDRLSYLLPGSSSDITPSVGTTSSQVDRSSMYSEAARRDAFHNWPHMNYKWALPDPMAQAGFYHQPSSTGDDRAMCFTCNVCLVCWEPTDEPWSEHERHSPQCPFVKGEYTQNVPLSVTCATEPAQLHGIRGERVHCVSTSSSSDYIATSSLHGNIVVWNVARQLKKHLQFHVDPWDPIIAKKLGVSVHVQSDEKPSSPSAEDANQKESWPSDDSDEASKMTTSTSDSVSVTEKDSVEPVDMEIPSNSENDPEEPDVDANGSKMEVIEVTGAWKNCQPDQYEDVEEVPLDDLEPIPDPIQRCRPSQDVVVSSICITTSSDPTNGQTAAACTSTTYEAIQQSLVVGASIRKSPPVCFGLTSAQARGDSEVQALNRVNQAISEDVSPQIIADDVMESSWNGSNSPLTSPDFVPYLLVYDISNSSTSSNSNNTTSGAATSGNVWKKKNATENQSGLYMGKTILNTVQYIPQPMDSDDDLDVQIVGIVPPAGDLVVGKVGTSQAVPVPALVPSQGKSTGPTFGTVSSSGSQSRTRGSIDSGVAHVSRPASKEGQVVQCLSLPSHIGSDYCVNFLVPYPSGKYIAAVLSPKIINDADMDSAMEENVKSDTDSVANDTPTEETVETTARETSKSPNYDEPAHGGYILIYRVTSESGVILLEETPVKTMALNKQEHAVISVSMLTSDVAQVQDDEDSGIQEAVDGQLGLEMGACDIDCYMVLTTHGGQVRIVNTSKVLVTITPPEGDKFVSTTYCSGIERLCCLTQEGKLFFYVIGPRKHQKYQAVNDGVTSSVSDGSNMTEDVVDGDPVAKSCGEELLIKQALTTPVLQAMCELTQFEDLVPRFSATVPQCWTEIQQEQQQRRHPQHLHQHGDTTHHTRSWRLQHDSTSYDEHVFELVLPKPTCVGHVDVKFSLHLLCTTPPNVQFTLLKQNISNIGWNAPGNEQTSECEQREQIDVPISAAQVDEKIHFNMEPASDTAEEDSDLHKSDDSKLSVIYKPLSADFLEKHRAEVVCGPVDLSSFVDLSRNSGVVTLTSPQLLKVKSKSFLLHIKSLPGGKKVLKSKSTSEKNKVHGAGEKHREKFTKIPADGMSHPVSATERLSASAMKQKLETMTGCDWLQELSITVRRSRKTPISRDRLQRCALLETAGAHERLILVACGQDVGSDMAIMGSCTRHRQKLALDILTWVAAIQAHDIERGGRTPNQHINSPGHASFPGSAKAAFADGSQSIVFTVQANLAGLVKACFVDGCRDLAHQCAKLITLCIDYAGSMCDREVAPSFNYALLQSLLECLPLAVGASSAGALHWLFVMLGQCKGMDAPLAAQKCAELLTQVAHYYNQRHNQWHSLLKARFGLYGNPLDTELFDIDAPQLSKPSVSTNMTYAGMVGASTSNTIPTSTANNNNQTAAGATPENEQDFRDLLNLTVSEKGQSSANSNSTSRAASHLDHMTKHVCGLLEVEPLHFVCHATSDGTRMERLDTGAAAHLPTSGSTLSGTINFGESLQSATGPALTSLSSAMASAEQQLAQLQQKQLQLLKLQQQKQKLEAQLAESSKKYTVPAESTNSGLLVTQANSSVGPYTTEQFPPVKELFPPGSKNVPFFMTPPVTPPNESYQQIYVAPGIEGDPGKPPTGKMSSVKVSVVKGDNQQSQKPTLVLPTTQGLFQLPPPQVLVIERMHSGARRFVVLDFGKPVVLTDILIPACNDLASLSIDIWSHGEEVDGQRLVVAPDIGLRSLVMNDIMPAPVCRYLKITTIGRYGGSTTRARIPIGSFYGHTFILPWEHISPAGEVSNGDVSHAAHPLNSATNTVNADQSQIFSQLSMFLNLQEDIQCRFSLARSRLLTLLAAANTAEISGSHTHIHQQRNRHSDEDSRVIQAYNDCMQLQLQWNLAQHAIRRLQNALGIRLDSLTPVVGEDSCDAKLKRACTDKLRVLAEHLLDTLLGMTLAAPSVGPLPASLHAIMSPATSEGLFRHLCIQGTKRMQIHAGMLLVRVCGSQSWWGNFLGSVLQEYFVTEQPVLFPQDRIFLLLAALGQRSLAGPCAINVLESLLLLLARLLTPLLPHTLQSSSMRHSSGQMDLTLVSWLLLFLGKCLDSISTNASDEADKGAASSSKDAKGSNGSNSSGNRWDFIHGEGALHSGRSTLKNVNCKVYRRKLQKRLMHHKQQLLELQQAKKNFMASQIEKTASLSPVEAEAIAKIQEQAFKKQFKQYSSKHFKDIINIRRTDGDLLKKIQKDPSHGDKENDGDADSGLTVSREKCVPVVKGLVALLLSMDFTCNVDLFIISCKVIARIAQLTRPAITLSEVMSQEELERFVLLACSLEYNHPAAAGGSTGTSGSWGGPWAVHSITCLLQDLLEGERLYPIQTSEPMVDEEVSVSVCETDDSLQNSTTLPTMDEDSQATDTTAPEISQAKDASSVKDKESSYLADLLDEDYLNMNNPDIWNIPCPSEPMAKPMESSMTPVLTNTSNLNWGPPPMATVYGEEGKKVFGHSWKNRLVNMVSVKSSVPPQGVSTAMDSRLEMGVQLTAHLRLKVMLSMAAETIHSSLAAPLPQTNPAASHQLSSAGQNAPTDDEQLSEASLIHSLSQQQVVPSAEMLSTCFNHLFSQLQRIDLETLLQMWFTLNHDIPSQEDGTGSSTFDPTVTPNIPLNQGAVTSLLSALSWHPSVSVRTWLLSFQTLSLLANLRVSDGHSGDRSLAIVMISDTNMMNVLVKFLSGTCQNGPVITSQETQVGPIAVQAFHDFLVRLQLKCSEANGNHLKELLLRLVYILCTDSAGRGALDAQCILLQHMLDQSYEGIDITNAISLVESVAIMVYQHLMNQPRATASSILEANDVGPRSCFSGRCPNVLRASDLKTLSGGSGNNTGRDTLICNLMKLVNLLIQMPLPAGRSNCRKNNAGTTAGSAGFFADFSGDYHSVGTDLGIDSPMTDMSKISHSMAGSGIVATSTPNIPRSEESGPAETDEQKTETAAAAAAAAAASTSGTSTPRHSKPLPCTHYPDKCNPCEQKEVRLADIVLGHQQIMGHLLQALSCCSGNTMATIFGANSTLICAAFQDSFSALDLLPVSVGDGIFQILITLNRMASEINLVIRPIYDFLAGGLYNGSGAGLAHLSEPFLWYILRILDCEKSISIFLEMGGIELVCHNVVNSNRRVINTTPSLVSNIMHYFGSTKSNILSKKDGFDSDTGEGLQNFAPLGTITSSSPTAGPADVLIQSSPPHRRARSAAWSYHFYPDEIWVDLTVTLPCAVLLHEVHIQPHVASLATCPAAVSVEVSRDGLPPVPVSAPVNTTGLTCIKVHLQRAEVVTSVTVRLHKPRDSTTIGLSQVILLGSTAFSEASSSHNSSNMLAAKVDFCRTSVSWLRLLHHCLSQNTAMLDAVAAAAAPTPNLLVTCTALLVSPSAHLYTNNIEAVLLKIGLHSTEIGLVLIDHLLRNATSSNREDWCLPLHGKVSGVANDYTLNILFQLGVAQDVGTEARVKAMTEWLGDSARVALQKSHGFDGGYRPSRQNQLGLTDLPTPAAAHVHCVAAILWHCQEISIGYDLKAITGPDLLSSIYEWSIVLPSDSILKRAVDCVLCSLCYIHPEYFSTILEWMGVILNPELQTAMTDDHKDQQQHQQQHCSQPMTDDSKADSEAQGIHIHSEDMDTQDYKPIELHKFGHMTLDEAHLSTLGVACQSPAALKQLLDSGFLEVLCQGLYEFCSRELLRLGTSSFISEARPMTDAGKSSNMNQCSDSPSRHDAHNSSPHGTSPQRVSHNSYSSDSRQDSSMCLTADLVAPVLAFLAEIARETDVKEWLGNGQGSIFWPVLLNLLCAPPAQIASSSLDQQMTDSYKIVHGYQLAAMETATVEFFSQIVVCHPQNQLQFSTVLCEVIRGHGSASSGCGASSLSGFLRRLFLQVLLEDEKVTICSSYASSVFCRERAAGCLAALQHPSCGAGNRHHTLQASLHTTCGKVQAHLLDTPLMEATAGDADDKKTGDDLRKDNNDIGIEMADTLSAAAGLQAKERREKNKTASPPRPPSRRGHRTHEHIASVPYKVPTISLHHSLLPGQPLPADLTLFQLLVLLHQRGFPMGKARLDFTLKVYLKVLPGSKPDKRAKRDGSTLMETSQLAEWGENSGIASSNEHLTIPEEVLLDTPSFPSALQVFAGVGGLALLAEHLPLLYPEVSRQVTPPGDANGKDGLGSAGSVQDWVTMESTEDMYEEIFEPVVSNQPMHSKPATTLLPSIPPHSLVAFGMFLRLPGYAEVLLKEKKRAQCLLRLVLGVTDDGDGGHILTSPIANALPTLPFQVLKMLFDGTPLSTDDGVLLRRMTLETGAVHLILACLSVLSHHAPRVPVPGFHHEIIAASTQASTSLTTNTTTTATTASTVTTAPSTTVISAGGIKTTADEKSQHYWAKGTGFGTGSTASSWDAEQALLRQKSEEEHVTCLLQVLASYVNPGGHVPDDFKSPDYVEDSEQQTLPSGLPELLNQSCLVPAISSYLRNDSVLDMARHVPLYRALLELLRGLAVCPGLVPLLLPLDCLEDTVASVSSLLDKMKACVDTYANRLKSNKGKGKTKHEDDESEGLALLIPDIQETTRLVDAAIERVHKRSAENGDNMDHDSGQLAGAALMNHTDEEQYLSLMKELQFDTYELVHEDAGILKFTGSHHYESNVKAAGDVNNAARARRLAQEAVTLSTSLPLSASSSVFVRCDEERLDIMKVLITGPSDTPYGNGCFEFDVYFPQDYPNSPPLINLETTGNHTVRFNPNLYNDGKVCLSVLNTWHGRPEEKWNAQTSSFLQVLVSIQSLILVSEPYFNEPGYERSRGTPSGNASSREYDANIRQATVKWAMLEQLRNPSACFKEIVEQHFWRKRNEITLQIEGWIGEMEANSGDKRTGRTIAHSCVALKRHFTQLKEELNKMKPPSNVEEELSNNEDDEACVMPVNGAIKTLEEEAASSIDVGNSKCSSQQHSSISSSSSDCEPSGGSSTTGGEAQEAHDTAGSAAWASVTAGMGNTMVSVVDSLVNGTEATALSTGVGEGGGAVFSDGLNEYNGVQMVVEGTEEIDMNVDGDIFFL